MYKNCQVDGKPQSINIFVIANNNRKYQPTHLQYYIINDFLEQAIVQSIDEQKNNIRIDDIKHVIKQTPMVYMQVYE